MIIKFSDKCKKPLRQRKGHAWKILENQPQKFIGWIRPLLTSISFTFGLICVKCPAECGRFNHFKYFEDHKSYVNVGLSPSKNICFVCFNESPLKMVKNGFYFILKALFVSKISKFLCWLFGRVEKTAWLER